jgi:hypothetical protein
MHSHELRGLVHDFTAMDVAWKTSVIKQTLISDSGGLGVQQRLYSTVSQEHQLQQLGTAILAFRRNRLASTPGNELVESIANFHT